MTITNPQSPPPHSTHKFYNYKKLLLLIRKRSFVLLVILIFIFVIFLYQTEFSLIKQGYKSLTIFSITTPSTVNTNIKKEKGLHEDPCLFDFIKFYKLWNKTEPFVSFIYKNNFIIDNKEIVIENMHKEIPICIIVALPKRILTKSTLIKKKFTPYNIFSRAVSHQIIQPIPMMKTKNHSNIFRGLTYIKYPGNYSINVDIEIGNFEDYKISLQSENSLIVTLKNKFLLSNDALPNCAADSDFSGIWMPGKYYNFFHPFIHYETMVEVDYGTLYVPTKCKMKYVSPFEQLICMENRAIHAYGDEILWNNLYGASVGQAGESWCGIAPHQALSVCGCKVPPFTLLPGLPFAHLKSAAFDGSIYFQPMEIIQNFEWLNISTKNFMKDQIPKENIVLVSVSNDIPDNYSISGVERTLNHFFNQLRKVYPVSPIIIRTPEPYTLVSHLNTTTRAHNQQVRNVTITAAKNIGAHLWDAGIIDGREWGSNIECQKNKTAFRVDAAGLQLQILFNIYCRTMLD